MTNGFPRRAWSVVVPIGLACLLLTVLKLMGTASLLVTGVFVGIGYLTDARSSELGDLARRTPILGADGWFAAVPLTHRCRPADRASRTGGRSSPAPDRCKGYF